jgi:hypothetical protein
MSNFLSDLITRSFTDVPVIQPRMPSLFEPTAAEFFDEPQSSTPATAPAETIAPTNAPSVSKSPAVREAVTSHSIANELDTDAEERLRKRDAPEHESGPVIAKTHSTGKQTSGEGPLEVETKRIVPPVDLFRDGEKDTDKRKRPSEPLSRPRPFQSRRRNDFSSVEQRSSTSAPIIRVTIGRVEVRAVHPPAPAPKPPKPSPPKLSLEDYLRQRSKGSSR